MLSPADELERGAGAAAAGVELRVDGDRHPRADELQLNEMLHGAGV
jgi:hypothetical protein